MGLNIIFQPANNKKQGRLMWGSVTSVLRNTASSVASIVISVCGSRTAGVLIAVRIIA